MRVLAALPIALAVGCGVALDLGRWWTAGGCLVGAAFVVAVAFAAGSDAAV